MGPDGAPDAGWTSDLRSPLRLNPPESDFCRCDCRLPPYSDREGCTGTTVVTVVSSLQGTRDVTGPGQWRDGVGLGNLPPTTGSVGVRGSEGRKRKISSKELYEHPSVYRHSFDLSGGLRKQSRGFTH